MSRGRTTTSKVITCSDRSKIPLSCDMLRVRIRNTFIEVSESADGNNLWEPCKPRSWSCHPVIHIGDDVHQCKKPFQVVVDGHSSSMHVGQKVWWGIRDRYYGQKGTVKGKNLLDGEPCVAVHFKRHGLHVCRTAEI